MMDSLQVVSANAEQILNLTVDTEKLLSLRCQLEATHLTFLLAGMLVRDLSLVVLIPSGPVFN